MSNGVVTFIAQVRIFSSWMEVIAVADDRFRHYGRRDDVLLFAPLDDGSETFSNIGRFDVVGGHDSRRGYVEMDGSGGF